MFTKSPNIDCLNGELFKHLQSTTWLATDKYVTIGSSIEFENAIFEKPITISVFKSFFFLEILIVLNSIYYNAL